MLLLALPTSIKPKHFLSTGTPDETKTIFADLRIPPRIIRAI
jgi:hypothetical protein